MKKILFLIAFTAFLSCKKEPEVITDLTIENTENTEKTTPAQLGEELFDGKGMCATCHKPDAKVVGPSIKEIASIYKSKKASIALFLQGEGEPIVDPSQFEIMKANFAITKTMTDEELKAIEEYMLNVK